MQDVLAILFIVAISVFSLLIVRSEWFKQQDARRKQIVDTITDAVYRAAVNPAQAEDYAEREKETGYDRRLLFVYDIVRNRLGWRVKFEEVASIVDRILVSNPDFPNKVN